ncbi:MAG: AI-2E family transporter [Cyanobacteria bacterium J069]
MKWINRLPQWVLWGLALPLVVLNGWALLIVMDYFRQLLTIFVGANLLAFVLSYAVRWLQRQGLSRDRAILLVLLATLALLLVLAVTLIPILIDQMNGLALRLPTWIESSNQQFQDIQRWASARRLPIDLIDFMARLQEALVTQLQPLSSGVLGVGLGLAGSALDFVIMIALTFYLLLHGERLWDGILRWLPGGRGRQIRRSLRQSFHNYFSGQASLAVVMGLSMITVFLLLQVPFGLLFGLAVGVMTLIPLGAPLSICLISFLVGLSSFWLGMKMLVVGIVVDQAIENAIAPRLLGRFTGLNPVWVIVALLIGARVAGVLGILMAVPTAGFVKAMLDLSQPKEPDELY